MLRTAEQAIGVVLIVCGLALAIITLLDNLRLISVFELLEPRLSNYQYSYSREDSGWTFYTPYSSLHVVAGMVPIFALPFGLVQVTVGIALLKRQAWSLPLGTLWHGFGALLPFGAIQNIMLAINVSLVSLIGMLLVFDFVRRADMAVDAEPNPKSSPDSGT